MYLFSDEIINLVDQISDGIEEMDDHNYHLNPATVVRPQIMTSIKKSVPTRWNSTLQMLESIIKNNGLIIFKFLI